MLRFAVTVSSVFLQHYRVMKIQFASDLHLEFRENWRYLRDNGPMDVNGDILVLAGDTGYLGDGIHSVHPFWNWNNTLPPLPKKYRNVFS